MKSGDGCVNLSFVKQLSAVLPGPELDTGITPVNAAWFLVLALKEHRGKVGVRYVTRQLTLTRKAECLA